MQNLIDLSKLIMILSMTITFNVSADGNEEGIFKRWFESNNSGISSVKFEQYNMLCGSCHFPYQAGLMPAISWEKMMSNLDDHFGQPVKMTDIEIRTMRRYLLDNSAGHVNDEISNKILQSFNYNSVSLRITKTPFFIDKHNPDHNKVNRNNMGECDSCHQDAQHGDYNNDRNIIPDQSQKFSSRDAFKM